MADPEVFILPAAFTPQAPVVSAPQADFDLPPLLAFARLAPPVSGLHLRLDSVRQAPLDSGRVQASTPLDRFSVPA
jgi:hypothetical protein